MNTPHPAAFRHLPIRVAAVTTAVVAVVYVVIAVAVAVIVNHALVGSIDTRLTQQLAMIEARPDVLHELTEGRVDDLDHDGDARRFDAPLLVWVRAAAGDAYQSDPTAVLPDDLTGNAGPTTANIGGVQMRLVGGPVSTASGSGWVTIAQTVAEATNAGNTLILAEILTGPALLLLVFAGALTIGRRVAAPIEHARLAQLAFAADASHELRTPLSVIDAETSLALQSAREPAADRQTLERVRDETRALHRLVDDLLWLARFDAAPSPPAAEPIDLGALTGATADRFRAICSQRGMRLSSTVTGSQGPVITAPAEWVARLVSVLLDNAIRHSPDGASLSVKVVSDGGRVQLTVEDSGPGIPVAQRAMMFDRFHRGTGAPGGAGLGLAIADAIVRSTAGHWDIGDASVGGARMTVSWPRSPGRAFDEPSAEQEAGRDQPAGAVRPDGVTVRP